MSNPFSVKNITIFDDLTDPESGYSSSGAFSVEEGMLDIYCEDELIAEEVEVDMEYSVDTSNNIDFSMLSINDIRFALEPDALDTIKSADDFDGKDNFIQGLEDEIKKSIESGLIKKALASGVLDEYSLKVTQAETPGGEGYQYGINGVIGISTLSR
jgi:hypothetical protein